MEKEYYPHPRTPPILLQHARELRHPQTKVDPFVKTPKVLF
jgi:hypothetical protein